MTTPNSSRYVIEVVFVKKAFISESNDSKHEIHYLVFDTANNCVTKFFADEFELALRECYQLNTGNMKEYDLTITTAENDFNLKSDISATNDEQEKLKFKKIEDYYKNNLASLTTKPTSKKLGL
ncbi:hypothetical protein ABR857_002412 [Klebsiella pneumoniae]